MVGEASAAHIKRTYRKDRVFITQDFRLGLFFAALHPSGEGTVYQIEPIGEIESDPHWEFMRTVGTPFQETKQCESARIVGVVHARFSGAQ
jgi:hypothetical protein